MFSLIQRMKIILIVLASLLPAAAYSIGGAGDTAWPKGATIEVQLSLAAIAGTNGHPRVSGELLIKSHSKAALTIQDPRARQVLAFLVFDPLGNPVAPAGVGKSDPPSWPTHTLSPHGTYTHQLDGLDFVTGGAWLSYNLSPGKAYRVLAVYRPAGPNGPGFASQEMALEIPR